MECHAGKVLEFSPICRNSIRSAPGCAGVEGGALSAGGGPAPSVLLRLREATRAAHDRLETGLKLLDGPITAERYRTLLERFRGYCAPAEGRVEAIGAWEALGLDGAARAKTPRLEADLRHLGHDDASLARLPLCGELPRLDSAARAAGYLYVFEGATLGGAIISRRVAARLGYTREAGAAYFGSYGAEVGPMWKQFGAALARHASRTGCEPEIVAAADETFSTLERWLLRLPD